MIESTFLSGKVSRTTLPAIAGPSRQDAPALKRLLLPQGELAQFYDADEPIRYLAFIELRQGSIRGNHYHKVKRELIYLIQGEVQLVIEDTDTKARDTVPLRTGDLAVISPGIAHALRTIESGQAIEFSKVRFDPADIHRYPLVQAGG